MSKNAEKNDRKVFNLRDPENDNDEDDDFITFEYESKQIKLRYSNIVRYSKLIREKYVYSDVKTRLPEELHKFQKQYDINLDSIFLFFQLYEECFTVNDMLLTYKQFIYITKISEFL